MRAERIALPSGPGPAASRKSAAAGDRFYARMDEAQAARNPLFGGRVAHGYFRVSAAAGLYVDPPYGPVLLDP